MEESVLAKKMIHHLRACQNKSVSPQIEGAPNYRQADSLRVHGVAVPTIAGIQNVLKHVGAHKDGKQVQALWISLREEPVVYINGRPFVLRHVEKPLTNLEYRGLNRVRVRQMEARLKDDILMEASRYGNKIPVTDELPDGQMVERWEPVSTNSLKTLLEVYKELEAEGYLVDYERVPVTDEKSPKESDFDTLVNLMLAKSVKSNFVGNFWQIRKISQAAINTEIIFNCPTGRALTMTGMVIATLVYFKRTGASATSSSPTTQLNYKEHQGFPRNHSFGRFFIAGENVTINMPNSEEAIRRGEYAVVRSLIRDLEGGVEGKRRVDKVIDRCASMQNLREAIATYRSSILRQPDEKKREAALSFFVEYLERYYFLICFAVYPHSEGAFLQSGTYNNISFVDWMQARPELYSTLCRSLRRDPLGALGYAAMNPSLPIAALRTGAVLGSQTVLKSDHSPACQLLSLRYRVEGAPNFREVPGFAVYGVANPTIDGIRSVIEKGIDQDRVEEMEALLKDDILREAKKYEGAIRVVHETKNGQIFYVWAHVDADSVQTPLEVYKCLEADGIPVKYARVPISDGKALKSSDFDTLTSNIASASEDTAFVFNCQMGRGRTTTGTIIACLVKLRINYGRPIMVLYDSLHHIIVDEDSSSGAETRPCSSTDKGRAFGMDDVLLMQKITRLLDNGIESREALDAVIDRCSALQNIRETILQYRKVFNQQHVEPRVRSAALKRGAEYLERYFWLIAFAAYLGSNTLDELFVKGESKMTFKKWLRQRPEMQAEVEHKIGRVSTIHVLVVRKSFIPLQI